ncbi:hypothetical protein CgunFtcFv8_000861 [Champsocephalus gunnari]|uniref:Uncharacterized protein n=1 Tax=Champsocephalus gunnari TaxID=52237 RepID=A0AAN8DJ13_CHAGU|nr:hypothetical protein CgunFtcFv8_000861 [Champsocephalus gunnari]
MDLWTDGRTPRYNSTRLKLKEVKMSWCFRLTSELRALRDMVVEQKGELRHPASRVTAAESLVDALEKENKGQP